MDISQSSSTSGESEPAKLPHNPLTKYEGKLFAWFETGTEGLVWAIQEDGKEGYDGLVPIRPGDLLTITAPDGRKLFEAEINCDYKTGWQPRWEGAEHGQPVAKGYWIHWTQHGWSPDDWAELFLDEKNRGTLTRKEKPQ